MSRLLGSYERMVCDGYEPGEMFLKDYGDGVCANTWLMDAEYDPIRISFDGDGNAVIRRYVGSAPSRRGRKDD